MVDKMRKALAETQAKGHARLEYKPIVGGALRQTSRAGLSRLLKGSKLKEAWYNEEQRTSSARADELCKELKLQREFTCHLQCVLGIVP